VEAMMVTRLQKLLFLIGGGMMAAFLLVVSVGAHAPVQADAAALYKSKCFACHGATGEKKFDASKADDDLVQTILKGKKMEKPPNMPAYEEKGITADQAKALVAFMKSQKH
jgi:mono/diheme cytochrome c family protein